MLEVLSPLNNSFVVDEVHCVRGVRMFSSINWLRLLFSSVLIVVASQVFVFPFLYLEDC